MALVASTATETMPHPAPVDATAAPSAWPGTLLRLMWLASPALPVGGFSYSEGLEAAVEAGHIHHEASARDWLLGQMELSQARSDWPVCARAHAAWLQPDITVAGTQIKALNQWLLQTRETAELRLQTEQMGRSLTEWLKRSEPAKGPGTPPDLAERLALLNQLQPAPAWPVAFALAGVFSGANNHETALACAFSWAENMAQAAIKAVPLGQTAAQRVLQSLVNAIPAAVQAALQRSPAETQSFAPMLAILSAQHEMQYSRLFRS